MLKFFVILFGAFAVCAVKCDGNNRRMVGRSQLADKGQFPYMVSLRRPDKEYFQKGKIIDVHVCGGSIIDKQWILTSAKCAKKASEKEMTVRVGSVYNWHGTPYSVKKVIPHPKHDATTFENDIGLIKLNISINLKRGLVKIIERNTEKIDTKISMTMCGWGQTSCPGGVVDRLRYSILERVSDRMCDSSRLWPHVFNNNICTLAKISEGCCVGDYGGPLVYDGKLVGILSWHSNPCGIGTPDIFIKVSDFALWIDNTMKDNDDKASSRA